jgi:Tfp pilus assembly protein PilO
MNRSIFSLSAVVVAILIYFVGIRPLMDKTSVLRDEKTQKEALLEQAKQIDDTEKQLLQKADAISPEQKALLDTLLPKRVEIVRRALDLDTLASKNRLILQGAITPGGLTTQSATGDNPGYEKFAVSFTLIGTYDSVKNFLSDLSKSRVITDIDTLSLIPDPNLPTLFSYQIKLITYWLPDGSMSTQTP